MVKGLGVISDIPKDSGFPRVYAKIASRVNSILPFIKIAYPDMMGGDSSKELEPLNIKDRRVCRWVQNVSVLKIRLLLLINAMVFVLPWNIYCYSPGHVIPRFYRIKSFISHVYKSLPLEIIKS